MPVPDEIRDVEKEIDAEIATMPLWKHGRAAVHEGLMGTYRDGIELTFVRVLDAEVLGNADDAQTAMVQKHQLRNGAFRAMKWATKSCPEVGRARPISPRDLLDTILVEPFKVTRTCGQRSERRQLLSPRYLAYDRQTCDWIRGTTIFRYVLASCACIQVLSLRLRCALVRWVTARSVTDQLRFIGNSALPIRAGAQLYSVLYPASTAVTST